MAVDGAAGDVNASGSQGVQTGSGNTQINNWAPRQPLTPATLAALSPHAAVARIRRLSHDDAVDLFASAAADDLTAKLKALLLADEATAVAILADLDPLKAAVLINLASGGTGGEFGFPDDWDFGEVSGETQGVWQAFEDDFIASSSHGTYRVPDKIAGLDNWGFPIAAAETRDGVESRRFEKGVIYSSQAGRFAIRLEVAKYADDLGTWFPVSASEDAGPSGASGATGTMQRFKDPLGVEMVVYSSEYGDQAIVGGVLACYERLGGPASWLGFPLRAWPSQKLAGSSGRRQSFEGGRIYHGDGRDSVAVSSATEELVGDRLGWPVTEERPVGADGPDRIQVFENGVVTLLDGKREVWLRPQ
jgi:hypothetical protein